jgi:hypothetical protein
MKFLIALILINTAWANPQKVLELRQDVERLAQEVEEKQKENQSTLDVYLQRRQEIQAQLLREKFRADQLQTQKTRLSDALKKNRLDAAGSIKAPEWFAPLLTRLEGELALNLPMGEASNELEKIRGTLLQGKTTFETALIQTWFLLENSIRRRTSSEYLMTTVEINQKKEPAEIVRLGDLLAYVRTAGGEYGLMTRQGAKWTMTRFEDKSKQAQIEKLISQYKQNQKTGLYELPGMKEFIATMSAEKKI